jgi:hypothetical protein
LFGLLLVGLLLVGLLLVGLLLVGLLLVGLLLVGLLLVGLLLVGLLLVGGCWSGGTSPSGTRWRSFPRPYARFPTSEMRKPCERSSASQRYTVRLLLSVFLAKYLVVAYTSPVSSCQRWSQPPRERAPSESDREDIDV